MPKDQPLDPVEEQLWRALMRILVVLPRHLDSDMVRAAGLSANEYKTLVALSEASGRELRMTDLANALGLSGSRMTRLVDELIAREYVSKRGSASDGRGNVAMLTTQGMAKLKSAWPSHLSSARRRVFDHLEPKTVKTTAQALSKIAAELDSGR